MAEGTFFAGCDELAARVGDGELEGSVEVNQVYALYQHEGADFNHPRGGEAFYLRRPLFERAPEMFARFREVIEADATCVGVMIGDVNDLADQIPVRAPVEFVVLRRSAHPEVRDDGELVYERPPEMPRLTQAELDEIRRVAEPVVNPEEWLRQWHYHRGEGGHWVKGAP